MAVAFRASGSGVASATVATISPDVPSGAQTGDLLLAFIYGNNNQVVSPPASDGWSSLVERNNTTNMRSSIFWKICESDDPGATKAFTKPVDDNLLFLGIIGAYSGIDTGDPFDATTPSAQDTTTANDACSFADYDPTETAAFILAAAFYAENGFAEGSVTGTNPTFSAAEVEVQTGTGADASILVASGSSDGSATGTRSWPMNAPIDAPRSTGFLFGLKAAATVHDGAASITASVTVAALAVLEAVAAAAVSGVVTVAAVAGLLLPATTAVTGTGTASGAVVADYAASSSVSGVATLAGDATLIEGGGGTTHQAEASVTASGALSGAVALDASAASNVSAIASVGGGAGLLRPGAGTLPATATVAGTTMLRLGAAGALSGTATTAGSVTADYALAASGTAVATMTGTAEGGLSVEHQPIVTQSVMSASVLVSLGAVAALLSQSDSDVSRIKNLGAEVPISVTVDFGGA